MKQKTIELNAKALVINIFYEVASPYQVIKNILNFQNCNINTLSIDLFHQKCPITVATTAMTGMSSSSLLTYLYLPPFLSYEPYEPAEPTYDEEAPASDGENPETADPYAQTNGHASTDPSNAPNNVVAVGGGDTAGPSAGGAESGGGAGGGGGGGGRKNAVVGLREKKIPEAKRTTTPYMTKYERARVLGTRALQIRFVWE